MFASLDSRIDNEPRKRRDGYATGMAGEFFVMHALFRLGHLPTLTLRNTKTLDILVERKDGELRKVSVKAVRSGGKWPIGRPDAPSNPSLVYVFLIFRDFEDVTSLPEVYVIPSADAHELRDTWMHGLMAVYHQSAASREAIAPYHDAWHLI